MFGTTFVQSVGALAGALTLCLAVGCGVDSDPGSAIAATDFASVEVGERRSVVLERLGDPDNVQRTESAAGVRECVYFDDAADRSVRYQVCFAGHRVVTKGRY